MPLFQFLCRSCGAESELLIRNGESPHCPACASTEIEKQLSRITPLNASPAPMEGCGAGACCQMTGGACMN